jgi:hypothetical protein
MTIDCDYGLHSTGYGLRTTEIRIDLAMDHGCWEVTGARCGLE